MLFWKNDKLFSFSAGAGSSVHHKCNSAKHRIISPKVDPRSGGYSSTHSELQNNDVSEGKTEHSHSSKNSGGGSIREKRNGKIHKPVLLQQNSTEVSSTNQVEVPDTTQNSPVSISSGLNSDPDMADSPAVTGMGHVASVMSSLSQNVFMSEVTGDPVYSMSPTGGHNAHIMGPDATSHSLGLGVTSDSHKFAFPGSGSADTGGPGADGLSMLSATGISEELVLSNSLDSSGIKISETTMNFDPDCFLNNPKQGQTYGGSGLKQENGTSSASSSSTASTNGLQRSPTMSDSNYCFSSTLVKNIKTEDTSFEQQLAEEGSYQVGPVVSCSVSSGSGSQNSLTLTPAASLLSSGGGLSPSTTLEQMDFSAINAKQDYAAGATVVSYSQAMNNLAHQNQSPSFFLQEAPQTAQNQQGRQSSSQKGHLLEHNTTDGAYMGLQVVKTGISWQQWPPPPPSHPPGPTHTQLQWRLTHQGTRTDWLTATPSIPRRFPRPWSRARGSGRHGSEPQCWVWPVWGHWKWDRWFTKVWGSFTSLRRRKQRERRSKSLHASELWERSRSWGHGFEEWKHHEWVQQQLATATPATASGSSFGSGALQHSPRA